MTTEGKDWNSSPPPVDPPFSPPGPAYAAGPSEDPPPSIQSGSQPGERRPRRLLVGAVAIAVISGALGVAVGAGLSSRDSSESTAGNTPVTRDPASPASPGSTIIAPGSTAPGGAPLDVKAILAKVGPSVVDVVAQRRDGMGDGSGIAISADGYILTNAHVVADATRITITTGTGSKALTARLVGADEDRDVALLQVDGGAAALSEGAGGGGFTPAELGRSADLKVGDDVVAIGNALGLRGDPTVTRGIVSALNRAFDDLTGMIQTDAAINPGNSGGPLVNGFGQVIGINTAGAGEEGQNINFAIPIDAARAIAERLKSGLGAAPVAFLGVATSEPTDGGPGATIMELVPGGPAAQAGLAVRDRIVTFDGKPVESADALSGIILDRQPGDTVDVIVERDGSSRTIKVRLGTRPPRQ
jgi:S1-C subfamily serine protease